VEVGRK